GGCPERNVDRPSRTAVCDPSPSSSAAWCCSSASPRWGWRPGGRAARSPRAGTGAAGSGRQALRRPGTGVACPRDTSLPPDQRATLLVDAMSLEQKIQQIAIYTIEGDPELEECVVAFANRTIIGI